jgi:nitrogen regulatory protein P-II 1
MKLIEAVINRLRLQEVRSAMDELGVVDVMESAVTCHQQGQVRIFRGLRFVAQVAERVKLEIVSADDSAGNIAQAIGAVVRSGSPAECRIAIRPYQEVT